MKTLPLEIRPATLDDVEHMAAYAARNVEHLRAFTPVRPPDHERAAAIRERLLTQLAAEPSARVQYVAFLDGELVAQLAISNIVRAAFQSAHLGYSVDAAHCGRGIATQAVAEVVVDAFTEQGLHRLEAGTLVDNVASQRVLLANGFERIGLSRRHLQIAGAWRDHLLFARTHDQPWSVD